jgi:hypothetical protein
LPSGAPHTTIRLSTKTVDGRGKAEPNTYPGAHSATRSVAAHKSGIELRSHAVCHTIDWLFSDRRWALHLIEAYVGGTTKVRVVEPGTLERSQGKAKRVLDLRSREQTG